MERLKFGVFILSALLIATACSKSDTKDSQMAFVDKMEDMQVSSSFLWSASLKGNLQIEFSNPDNISVDREYLYLENAQEEVLAKTRIQGSTAIFDLILPANGNYQLYFPYTGQRFPVSGPGSYNFTAQDLGANKSGKTNSGGTCTVCASPIENNLAELPVIPSNSFVIVDESTVPGWETTAPDNQIEIWSTGYRGVPAQEGQQFFEINANNYPNAALFQSLCLEPGSTIRWSVYHRARAGVDVARVLIGADVNTAIEQAIMSDGTSAWGYHSGTYVVPANQTTTVFVFQAVSTGSGNPSVGNFLDNFRIECDEDGDGTPDVSDDFPQDPNLAFRSYFPNSGKQVIAFEDLWPATGDYDFNDLVISQQVEIARNSNQELVRADFTLSIDAIGAGLHNGLALLLRKSDGSLWSSEKVNSFTGAISNDPNNTNGFIVSDDIFNDLSSYYQNNGVGPSKSPDTLRFTLFFNPGTTEEIIPELYLFRSDNRGLEVHLPAFSGSAAFDQTLANTLEDAGGFKTSAGLPWAIEIVSAQNFNHPKEKVDMLDAFPQFQTWATSLGAQNQTWYDYPVNLNVFELQP